MNLARCDGCASIINLDDDPTAFSECPKGNQVDCAFCRGEETYEEATARQTELYKAMKGE